MKEGEDYPSFLKSKAEDIGAGTLFGGVAGKATQALLNPQVGEKVKKLIASGQEYLTPGQLFSETPIVGKMLQRGEQALTSTPLAGSLISGSMQKSIENFNKNIANKVLQPLGEKLDKGIKAGHEMVDYVHNKVANAYDDIAPRLRFDATHKVEGQSTIKTLTDRLKNVTDTLTPEDEVKVAGAFNKFIINPLEENLTLSGEKFREAESKLGKAAYDAFKKGDYNISNAYRDLQDELRQQLANQNPKYAQRLSNIHDSFKKYLRLERAASYRGAEEGMFTPAHFRSAVESIAGKKQTARGRALMQDEAKDAEAVLGRKVPDSGTAERFLSSLLLKKLGMGAVEGAANVLTGGIPLALTGAVYNPVSQRAITKLATERPEWVRAIAPGLQSIASRAAAIPREEDNKPVGGLNLTTP
jgi:gas vesicle protein